VRFTDIMWRIIVEVTILPEITPQRGDINIKESINIVEELFIKTSLNAMHVLIQGRISAK